MGLVKDLVIRSVMGSVMRSVLGLVSKCPNVWNWTVIWSEKRLSYNYRTKKMRLRLPAQRQGDDIHWSDNPTMSNIEDDIKNQLGLSHFTVLTAFPLYVCSQCDKAWNLIRSTVICHFVFTTTRDTSMDCGGTVWELCSEVFFEVLPFQPKNPIPLQLNTNQNQWAINI